MEDVCGNNFIQPAKTMPIAIVGMSCRLGGDATSPQGLWHLVSQGRSAWSPIPKDRFNSEAFYHPVSGRVGSHHVKGAHFIKEDVGLFDAQFFNFSVDVAADMDPQIRLQLESTFEAFESAGMTLDQLAGSSTAVFSGQFVRDYSDSLMRDPDTLPRFYFSGNGAAMMSARIAHFFDLRGPCLTLDTGCSSGLTALHQACQSIRCGESKMAVVTGSNLLLSPENFNQMTSTGFLSKEGLSFSFDSRGSGYGRGEGVATLIVKSLEDALKDNDPIRAVIRESCLNQDGKTPTITSPNQAAQEALIQQCYRKAGLNPLETAYVEAHGTGTKTGDPIEARAIHAILGGKRPRQQPLLIGSIKSNLGHCEAASALAGIIKVAMAFERGYILPNYDFQNPNPDIPFQDFNMKVPTKLVPWPKDMARRASVNSFGYGGTNGHVILEDPAAFRRQPSGQKKDIRPNSWQVFSLSGKDEITTRTMISRLREYLQFNMDTDEQSFLRDIAYTLGQRRSRFAWKTAICACDKAGLITALTSSTMPVLKSTKKPRLGFVFTGQGAQWYAMGRELISVYPVFRDSILEAEQILRDFGCPWSAMDELLKDAMTSRLSEVELSLSLCTAVQISLVKLLRSWGIHPTAVTGHSSGEAAAAFAAGALTMKEALAVAWNKGTLAEDFQRRMQRKGGMLAVGMSRKNAQQLLKSISSGGTAVVACINSPNSVTLSGDIAAIAELESTIATSGRFVRRLKVNTAYHSSHMEALADAYRDHLNDVLSDAAGDFNGVVFSSSTLGKRVVDAQQLGPNYWVKNMVQPVEFVDAFTHLCIDTGVTGLNDPEKTVDIVLEIGPHGALAGPIRQILDTDKLKGLGIIYQSCLTRGKDAAMTMQELVSFLLCHGYPVDLGMVNSMSDDYQPSTIPDLPSYPWNHQTRYWSEPRVNRLYRLRGLPKHDLLGVRVSSTDPDTPTWRHFIRQGEMPWVKDHQIQSTVLYPAAGYVCMAIEATSQLLQSSTMQVEGYRLRDITIGHGLVIPDTNQGVEVHLRLRSCRTDAMLGSEGWFEFWVSSVTATNDWTEHCRGYIAPDSLDEWTRKSETQLKQRKFLGQKIVEPKKIFAKLHELGIQHGQAFQNIVDIQADEVESLVTFTPGNATDLANETKLNPILHPITLDSVIVSAFTALPNAGLMQQTAMLPHSIDSIVVRSDDLLAAGAQWQAHDTIKSLNSKLFTASSITTKRFGPRTVPVIEVSGLRFKSLRKSPLAGDNEDVVTLCSHINWVDDLTHIKQDDLSQYIRPSDVSQDLHKIPNLEMVASYFIQHALETMRGSEIKLLGGHHRKFYQWMLQHQTHTALDDNATKRVNKLLRSNDQNKIIIGMVRNQGISGEMLCRIGENIPNILWGKVTPLELMTDADLLYKYYESDIRVKLSHKHLQDYLKVYIHKYPRANILEVGAGMGGCTQVALQVLGGGTTGREAMFSHYDFTDISGGFLHRARERFSAWNQLMEYKILDLDADPTQKSFEASTYDLVLACRSLHASKQMIRTLSYIRRLLKPGGKLIVIEDTAEFLEHQLIYGVLPGWWAGEEDTRKNSPNMPISSWNSTLQRCGFTGVDLDFSFAPGATGNETSTMMVCTAQNDSPKAYETELFVTYVASCPPQKWMADLSQSIARATGSKVKLVPLSSAEITGKAVVFLEMVEAELSNPALEIYEALRKMLLCSKGVLWLTRGASMECPQPIFALSHGLLRTLRCENTSVRYVSLDLDSSRDPWTADDIRAITSIYESNFQFSSEQTILDSEYSERNGVIKIPRIVESRQHNKRPVESEEDSIGIEVFHQVGKKLDLEVDTQPSQGFVFRKTSTDNEKLPDDWVEIAPEAFAVDHGESPLAAIHDGQPSPSYGMVGCIARMGCSVTNFVLGQRVCSLAQGPLSSSVRVPWAQAFPIPGEWDLGVAAQIPTAFVTAHSALHDFARIKEGETVLVHAATRDIGRAAIILAELAKAHILVTASSPRERSILKEEMGIPEERIFLCGDALFASEIMAFTGDKGVDVIFNPLSGKVTAESWKCIGPFGRFCQVGKEDIASNRGMEMGPFAQMASFMVIDPFQLAQYRARDFQRLLSACVGLISRQQDLCLGPVMKVSISTLEQVSGILQITESVGQGSVVITAKAEDKVKVLPPETSAKIMSDASYLIVGGMGGIGQAICRRLVQLGVRNLILLSRNAEEKIKGSQAFLKELESSGCQVRVRNCDVTSKDALDEALSLIDTDTVPIKGVIQAAMVLRDKSFHQMSYEDYIAAVRPKVCGTWNLHKYFASRSLSFFIVLSSFVGVGGNPGQANYAAGGAFEDAVARHRSSQGLPATTIDLGPVKEIGYLTNHESVADRLANMGFKALGESQVLALVEDGIKRPLRGPSTAQVVTGITGLDWDNMPCLNDPRFGHFKPASASRPSTRNVKVNRVIDVRAQLAAASTLVQADEIILAALTHKLAAMFSMPASEVDPTAPLSRHGVDSLVAAELRNWLSSSAKSNVSIFDVTQSGSLVSLARAVARKSELCCKFQDHVQSGH